jgi:putative transposase
MDTRTIAAEYRLAHWAQIVREQKESRLSVSKYCENAGLHKNTFFYWQKKLRVAAYNKLQEEQHNTSVDTGQSLIPSGWAICETKNNKADAGSKESANNVIVVDIGRFSVRVSTDTDQDLLSKVCRVLVALC